MKRLTFGVTSSSFVATETLRQVAKDFDVESAVASEIVLKDFYVDDLLTGTNNLDEAIILRSQLNVLLERGGFLLRKWRSNSKDLLATIPEELKEKEPVTKLKFPGDCLKALVVHWDTDQDTLHVSTPNIQLCGELTKRKLVSDVAKTYVMLGWFAPAVFFAKCLLQRTWEARISWDDPVPREILIDWQRWAKELPMLTSRPLQIYYMESSKEADAIQIHGFSDASEKGYSAVVYIRILYSDSTVSISLMAAKTKVAPIKRETIPRLELSGALLLAKLLDSVKTTLNFSLSQIYAWSDSKIVLAWLDGSPRRLQTYVANRVSQIMELLPSSVWRHVPTATNPADCASRGMLPQDFLLSGGINHPGYFYSQLLGQFLLRR